jgi:ATP-dependent Zn protease
LQVSSGATDDLRQATNMARHMVMQCGLNDELGPLYIEDEKLLSESLKQQVDAGAARGVLTKWLDMLALHSRLWAFAGGA